MSAGAARPAWHVGEWGVLGWLETALKVAGIGVGIAALVAAAGRSADRADGARLTWRDPDAGGHLVAFAALMLAGDLVKLAFLRTTGFTVRAVPPAAVYGLVGAYVGGYVVLILTEIVA